MTKKLNFVCDYKDEQTKDLVQINCLDRYPGTYTYPTGIFHKINFYHFKFCGFDDINETENYYYIINTPNNIHNIIPMCGGLPLNNKVIETLKSKSNFNVLYINDSESDSPDVVQIIEGELSKLGVNPKQFYLMNNNSKLKSDNINVHTIDSLLFTQMDQLKKYEIDFVEDKKFLFMTHNRHAKRERILLLAFLKKYDILDDTDWSLIMGKQFNRLNDHEKYTEFKHILNYNQFQIKDIKNEIDFISSFDIKRSHYEQDFIIRGLEGYDMPEETATNDVNMMTTFTTETYMNSYINITTESNFDMNDCIHITEKTYKPFYFYQIPMIFSTYEHEKYVKDKFGLDFFEDFVDHSYDLEKDNTKRFFMFVNEVRRLKEKKDDVIKFYKSNKDRFIKNKELLFEAINNKKDYNYFQNLI